MRRTLMVTVVEIISAWLIHGSFLSTLIVVQIAYVYS